MSDALALRLRLNYPTEVAPGLWLGGARWPCPPEQDFDLIVTVCEDWEEDHTPAHDEHIRLPMADATTSGASRDDIVDLASLVAERVSAGESVLVRCHWGLERSAMVAALTMRILTGASFDEVLDHLRRTRGEPVLYNPDSSAWSIASGDLGGSGRATSVVSDGR